MSMLRYFSLAMALCASTFLSSLAAEGPKLELKVLDKESGEPVKEIRAMQISSRKDGGSRMENALLKSEKGVYSFDLAGLSAKQLAVSAPDYTPDSVKWTEPQASEAKDVYSLSLALSKAKEIGGIIVDENGNPVPGVKFTIYAHPKQNGASSQPMPGANVNAVSGKDGRWTAKLYIASAESVSFNFNYEIEGFAKPNETHFQAGTSDGSASIAAMAAGTYKTILKRGEELKGKVLLPDGSPAEGASVAIQYRNDSATCKQDGAFSIRYEKGQFIHGNLKLIAAKDGYAPKEVDVLNLNDTVQITLEKGETVNCRIVDADGKPIANAYLNKSGFFAPGSRINVMKTGSDGRVAIENVPPEGVKISISAASNSIHCQRSVMPSKEELEIRIEKPAEFSGRVVDAGTGAELKSFSIAKTLKSSNSANGGTTATSSKMDGQSSPFKVNSSFGMEDMQGPLEFEIRIIADGYKPQSKSFQIPEGKAQSVEGIEFKMEPLKRGSGLIVASVSQPDGLPADGASAKLSLRFTPGSVYQERERSFASGADGSCRIELADGAASEGVLTITHKSGGLVMDAKDLKDGAKIQLQAYAKVSGRWIGKPFRPETLSIANASAMRNPWDFGVPSNAEDAAPLAKDGKFSFDKVIPGPFVVKGSFAGSNPWQNSYSKWGVAKAGETLELELGKDFSEAEVELILPDASVMKENGLKLAADVRSGDENTRGAFVQGHINKESIEKLAAEGAENFTAYIEEVKAESFKIPVLPSGAKLGIMMKAGQSSYGIDNVALKPGELKRSVNLSGNKNLLDRIAFLKLPKTRSISGIVSYQDGTPAEGLRVGNFSFIECMGGFDQSYSAVTGKGGVFQVEKLPASKKISCYILAKEPYGNTQVSFDESEETKEIVLQKPASIKGGLKLPSGAQARMIIVRAAWNGGGSRATIHDESKYVLKLNNIASDNVEVTVSAQSSDGKLKSKESKVKASLGEDLTLDLELEEVQQKAAPK